MVCKWKVGILVGALALLSMPHVHAQPKGGRDKVRRVLLISIDGMHAVDYANCVASKTCPTLAGLGETGVNYTRTSTSRPSDSFPGLMALVTGGTPRTVGAFYDVAYDRVLAPPIIATGNGLPGAGGTPNDCVPNHIHGTQTEYEEGVEYDQTAVNGVGMQLNPSPYSMFDGGTKSINPMRLERDPFNGCKPVYPWNFVRTNTIYGVIHAAGGYTAWSDKHPVYASVSGPNTLPDLQPEVPAHVDDYYAPEVNSNVVNLPMGFMTANGVDCSNISANTGGDWTTDFDSIKCYDQLKVNAIVNEINGKTHLGDRKAPVPVIFGMNFQAVSVGEKLIKPASETRTDKNSGGYEDAAGTPRPLMLAEIQFVDAAIGQMVSALEKNHLLDSTVIIITAKHGQSPIEPSVFFPIPGKENANGNPPSFFLLAQSLLPAVYADPNNGLGLAEDDISQIWLTDSGQTANAVGILEKNGVAPPGIGLGQILYGTSLTDLFNTPGVPNIPGPCCKLRDGGDPRTPDIIVLPNVGVVYTGNDKKQSEHGGFAWDDTNVMLLVSNPSFKPRTLHSFVETPQVAPTILKFLGLDPEALDAVRMEGTAVLPGLDFGDDDDR